MNLFVCLQRRAEILGFLFVILWVLEGFLVFFLLLSNSSMLAQVYLLLHAGLLAMAVWAAAVFLVRPFRETENAMRQFGNGAVQEEVLQDVPPVSEGFSAMLRQFHSMQDKEDILRLSIEQSRYIALQNQLNPHFLYNTLDALRGDALAAGMDEFAAITESLSTFFGYTISELDKYATVAQELGNVKDYFNIQQYRFGEALRLEIDFADASEDICDLYLTRMTLQPLVENAIYHGLEAKGKKGTVTIRFTCSQSELVIAVIDDGVGMPQEQVDRLNQSLQQPGSIVTDKQHYGGIALNNVNTRIRLLFGETYGIGSFLAGRFLLHKVLN